MRLLIQVLLGLLKLRQKLCLLFSVGLLKFLNLRLVVESKLFDLGLIAL